MSDDSKGPMLQFLRRELRTRDTLRHFRVCEDCQAVLQLINDQLHDFVVGASSRAISIGHVSVIKRLGLRTGAIQFLLKCRDHHKADQATRDRLDSNLGVLGYRKPLQPTGRGRSRSRSCDKFLRMLVHTSTLLVFLSRPDLIMDRSSSWSITWPIIMISLEDTLSNHIAIGSMVRLMGGSRILRKRDIRARLSDFDQMLTNPAKSRSTKPAKSTLQRNPPCAREID